VVDVGCGAGWFCGALAAAGFSVTGVEVAHEPLRRARERFPELDFLLVSGGGELPLAAASFDGAWLGEVLEHVQDGLGLLWEVARVVGPGGRLAVSTPDHGWGLRLRLGISRRAFEAHFEPRSDHVRFFTRRSLAALLAAGGFEQIQIRRRRGCCWSAPGRLDELDREPGGALRQRPEVTRPAELERFRELADAIGPAEARTGGAQRRGERVEIGDAEGDMVDPPLICAQAWPEQLLVCDREDLERSAALTEECPRDRELRQVEGSGEGKGKGLLSLRERGVEVANEVADVVELSEHRQRS
jgi:SAM-dependent methyltransferase